jgi:tRNA(Ile)-lysidine synthase
LLHALLAAGHRKITLCHLNHQLRGLFSSDDAAFVRELAEKEGLPFEIGRMNVQRIADEEGLSLETAARQARQAFFVECAKRNRCPRVLLAHHADDNAETILFNVLRGSAGLKGMQFSTELRIARRKLIFLRPLLHVRREEIDEFIEAGRLPYRDDSSNFDDFATRNRLRHEGLPLLEEIMDRDVVPGLVRAADLAREQEEIVEGLLEHLSLLDPQDRLFLPKLRGLPESLQRRSLFNYLKHKNVADLSSEVISRCLSLLDPDEPAKVNLPGGTFLRRRASRLFVER